MTFMFFGTFQTASTAHENAYKDTLKISSSKPSTSILMTYMKGHM